MNKKEKEKRQENRKNSRREKKKERKQNETASNSQIHPDSPARSHSVRWEGV